MPHIFISYRRDDAGYVAGMLCERLQKVFGPASVFIDVDTIPLGVDFREHLNNAVSKCDVLLAIIGDSWLGAVSQTLRRIDDPTDFVRIEIEAALQRQIPIVPVLVGEARMPMENDLPEPLRPLVFRNAAELRSGRDMNHHVELLIRGLRAHFAPVRMFTQPDTDAQRQEVVQRVPQASLTLKRIARSTLSLWRVRVYVNGKVVGKLAIGRSITLPVSPGEVLIEFELGLKKVGHQITLNDEETGVVAFEITPSGDIAVQNSESDSE